MTTSIIDGRIEAAELKRARGGVSVFRSITFQPDSGPAHMMKNAIVKDDVAAELVPGTRGRFYLYKAFDLKGVHGVRTSDGRATYGFPANNQKIFLILAIVNIAWITLVVTTKDAVPLLGVALLILAIVGYIFMGKGARETKAQFYADTGPVPG